MTFDKAIAFVLKWEAGTVDNPLDPGGLTKFGISARFFPEVRNADFSQDNAIAIYKDKYWLACKCEELPAPIAFILFDASVNQGQPNAIRMLQRTLGVPADGVIGPETVRAAINAKLSEVAADLVARRAFAYAIIPTVQRFGLGWFRRLAACHQAALEPG